MVLPTTWQDRPKTLEGHKGILLPIVGKSLPENIKDFYFQEDISRVIPSVQTTWMESKAPTGNSSVEKLCYNKGRGCLVLPTTW